MTISFKKYQSTGNDFILVDDRNMYFPVENHKLINNLCDRKLGIGADGLILVQNSEKTDFKMMYFNADGTEGSFCGNGSRAAVHFAQNLGLFSESCTFEAYDGFHEAFINDDSVSVKMKNVQNGSPLLNGTFIDTGSPHYIEFVNDVDKIDVVNLGMKLRYDSKFGSGGSNINFIERLKADKVKVRTYERGVENETLSCGTGVTACALISSESIGEKTVEIITKGGELTVHFNHIDNGYNNIWLSGPTKMVYKGEIDLQESIINK